MYVCAGTVSRALEPTYPLVVALVRHNRERDQAVGLASGTGGPNTNPEGCAAREFADRILSLSYEIFYMSDLF